MALDPRAKRLLDVLSLSGPPSGAPSIEQRRDGFAKLMAIGARAAPAGRQVDIQLPAGGHDVPIRIYDSIPDRNGLNTALVFFHGGGLVAGGIDTHDGICRALAVSSGAKVISVGYRLAPEHRFPASLEDAAFVLEWAHAHASSLHIDRSRIAIGGESAGALLATLITSGFIQSSVVPKAQLLLCPVVDLAGSYGSRSLYGKGFLIDAAMIQNDIEHCFGENLPACDIPTPLSAAAPVRVPPSVIITAECDPFRDEADTYVAMLQKAGSRVMLTCYPGMIHSFYGLPALLPQADVAMARAGRELAALLG